MSRKRRQEPLAYSGPRRAVLNGLGESWTARTLDTDTSGERTYAFNALGYRGPAFDPERPFLAYVFGESDAFGTGVEWHEAWAVRAAFQVAEARGFERDDVMVVNFAESGASNAYIARNLIAQCAHEQPDLVLVGLAEHDRIEVVTDVGSMSCGAWIGSDAMEGALADADLAPDDEVRMRGALRRGRAYLEFVGAGAPDEVDSSARQGRRGEGEAQGQDQA